MEDKLSLKIKKPKEEEIDLTDPELETDEVMGAVFDQFKEKFDAENDEEEESEDGLQEEEGEGEEEGREEEPVEEEGEKKEATEEFDEEDEAGEEKIEASISSSDFEPPSNWSDDAKEEFSDLPQKQQESILNMQRGMQGDFQKTMNSFSGIANALEPIKDECIHFGLKYEDAIRKMVGMHTQLMSNPVPAMRALMETYGVTPDKLLGVAGEDDNLPPKVAERISNLESQVHNQNQHFVNQQTASIDQQVAAFKEKAEFFDEVEQDMSMTVHSHQQAGQPVPPLQELYDRACWANPQVRAKLMAKKKADETDNKIKERKKKVAKSKRAARTAKRGSSGEREEKDPPKTLHDVLSQQWDEAVDKAGEAR